jgi:hypothetical protein
MKKWLYKSSSLSLWGNSCSILTYFQNILSITETQMIYNKIVYLQWSSFCKQGYVAPRLKSSLQKVYDNHHELVDRSEYIHISNDNESLPLYIEFFFFLSSTRLFPVLIIWLTRRMSYKKQELFTLRQHLGSPLLFVCIFCVVQCFLSTQDTGRRHLLLYPIKNRQSKDIGNIEYTRHRTKTFTFVSNQE